MKASDMTNEEFCFFEVEEDQHSFAFLRDYVWMRSEIADLRKRLKVAEKALEKFVNYTNSWELRAAEKNAKNALAAIREKGENNGK